MEIVIILVLVLIVLVFINMVMLTRYHNKVTKLDEVFKQKHDIIYNCCIECRAFLKKVQDLKFVTNFSDVDKTLKELKPMIKNITNVIDGLGIKDLKSDIRTVLSNQKLDNCKLNDILKTLDVELAIVKHIEHCLIAFTTDGIDAKVKSIITNVNEHTHKRSEQIIASVNTNLHCLNKLTASINDISELVKKIESNQTDDFTIYKSKFGEIKENLAEISSVIDCMREKVNYIETYILNNTKLKTASKMKTTKTTTTKANAKGAQHYD